MRNGLGLLVVAAALTVVACKEEGVIKVSEVTFNGVENVDRDRLEHALATRESSWIPWARKNYFDRSRFDADLKRIVAFYTDRGFPDARVTGFDVKLNDKQDAVAVTINISEGQPVVVDSVDFLGFESVPDGHMETVSSEMPVKVGRPRDRQQVITTHEMLVNELRDHGFPYAKVATAEEGGPDAKHVKITFTAQPGTLAYFGPVTIGGNESVTSRVIQRQLTFRQGQIYRRSQVQDSQHRLYGMELFQFVNIEPLDVEQQPAEVPIKVTVAEGKHQRVNFGVGYGTEEKGRVDGEYHHVNFLGGARSAGVHGRWSSLDRGVRANFNQPYFFHPNLSFGADGQQWYTFTPAYRSLVTGGKMTVTRSYGRVMSWGVSISSERDSSTVSDEALNDPTLRNDLIALGLDPTTGRQEGTLNAIGFDFQRSTADNLLNATRGYQLSFNMEDAGRLLPGSFSYFALSADARHYLPIGDQIVIASRLQLGNVDEGGTDVTNVPFAKKYFLGGATSLRGWGRYEVSPLSAGLPIGGNSLMAFSEELRAHLRGNLGGVLFLDAGNVWEGSWDFRPGDLRYAAGVGLRYQTPIGPIRFDVGYQLNPIDGLIVNGEPEQRRWRLHFSIGQAF